MNFKHGRRGMPRRARGVRQRVIVTFATGAIAAFASSGALAQMNPIPSHDEPVFLDSGIHSNGGDRQRVVWSDILEVDDAQWVRLEFRELTLAHDPGRDASSVLRIVSMLDGAEQTLDFESAAQWQNTSAYFNGDAVALELIALPNGERNRVVVDNVIAGDIPDQVGIETICDGVDDRILSDDKRAGRALPSGCTAWLFNDREHCMLSAGHCAAFGVNVVEFNVPLSNGNGSIVHPPPEDQYSVDSQSMQFQNSGIGLDWAYFGCFENSQTGLTAFEAQGDSYELALPEPVGQNDEIRITGYGTVSPPVDPSWNQVQKTHVGPYFSFSGSSVGYRTDTTGGNSGSPVIFEPDGTAIGIHTHGGCRNGSGNNWGTGANNSGLLTALDNPKGICKPQTCISLEVENLIAGRTATFTVTKGVRGDTVAVVWGTETGSFQFQNDQWCVDFGIEIPANQPQSRIIAQGFVDEQGEFSGQAFIPMQAIGMDVVFQAAVRDTCPDECMSNVLEETVL